MGPDPSHFQKPDLHAGDRGRWSSLENTFKRVTNIFKRMENIFKRMENMKTELKSWKVEGGWRHNEINEKEFKRVLQTSTW